MPRLLRAYHPDVRGPGTRLTLDEEESHHVARVLRLGAGDGVGVFDGLGREWECVIEEPRRSGTVLRVGPERLDPVDAGLSVELFQGLCRPERLEWAIQKATEVGVASVRPCRTTRSEAPAPSTDRLTRWRRVAREACKQSGRRRIPEIFDVSEVVQRVPPGTAGVVLQPGPESAPIGEWLCRPRPDAVWLLVGPEGGLDDAELGSLSDGGWGVAGLGPRTLRTETAGLVAAALVLHAWDDLGRRLDRTRRGS